MCQSTHFSQLCNLHCAEKIGGGKRSGTNGTQLATGVTAHHHITLTDLGGSYRRLPLGHLAEVAVTPPGSAKDDGENYEFVDKLFHDQQFTLHFPGALGCFGGIFHGNGLAGF